MIATAYLYINMGHNAPRQIAQGLRLRGVDIITAYEDRAQPFDDADLLRRAIPLNHVPFTRDAELLVLASERQRAGEPFAGVIYAHRLRVSIDACIHDLTDSVQFLP
ncbi:MAG TPA: hypothetical protein DCL15_22625 [Chloroflexi bacterium]|nr:hypothetical protein [Chloroflexota bacterium]HHW86477.1 hypothetical protein [Chloroflexota bacterium]